MNLEEIKAMSEEKQINELIKFPLHAAKKGNGAISDDGNFLFEISFGSMKTFEERAKVIEWMVETLNQSTSAQEGEEVCEGCLLCSWIGDKVYKLCKNCRERQRLEAENILLREREGRAIEALKVELGQMWLKRIETALYRQTGLCCCPPRNIETEDYFLNAVYFIQDFREEVWEL